jgi:hypothetical protein
VTTDAPPPAEPADQRQTDSRPPARPLTLEELSRLVDALGARVRAHLARKDRT